MATAMAQPTQEPVGSAQEAPVKLVRQVGGWNADGQEIYTDQFGNPWQDGAGLSQQSVTDAVNVAMAGYRNDRSPANAPAAPPIDQYSKDQIALGREALDFSKTHAGLTTRAAEMQIGAAGDFLDYFTTFQPLQKQIVSDAQGFDTTARREQAAAEAGADVSSGLDVASANRRRELASMGFDPSSGRYQSGETAAGVGGAALKAGAMNQARRQVETEGFARKTAAAGLGANLPGQQATTLTSGIAANDAGIKATQAGYGQAMGGYASALGANNALFGTQGNIYNAQLDYTLGRTVDQSNTERNWDTNMTSTWNSIFSSRKLKKDIVDHKDDPLMKVGIKDWRYKAGKAGAHQDDGEVHTGPTAEQFKKATGRGDGKTVSFDDEIEVTLNSVCALRKEVRQLSGAK
jgi:hypothetical protein